ncbi:cobalt ECF transporter T component CbiQ [Helicobacter mesocricetorum]|uniref:cobalt ECF transporter T component CbiQ n=1 Tax=Helicobacter mesocricetorum TaxID=87012 RepID=UPI000CF12E9C|nr:cobalt ECF transporter T component CbiQ [Helicobacter mesocricetorum]
MDKISSALEQIRILDELSREDKWINKIHPLFKLIVTLFYIILVVSYDKYHIIGLLIMLVYPLVMFELSGIPLFKTLYRLRFLLIFIAFLGIFNPFFDDKPLIVWGQVTLTGGVISMITLILKGILSLLASYLLIATTSMEGICYALRTLYVPKVLVTQILLTYRYIPIFLLEVQCTLEAYSLKTPKKGGISFKAWGSLVGLILLRSINRAYEVYQSMRLRGFSGEFYFLKYGKVVWIQSWYAISWVIVLSLFRNIFIFEMVGDWFL